MLFQIAYDRMQNEIATTEDTILELQKQLESLQKHLQALGSVEQASISALEQVKTAVSMINAVAPNEMGTFKDALLNELDSKTEMFPEAVKDDSEVEVDDDAPTEVTVEVYPVEEETTTEQPETTEEPDLSDVTTGYIRHLVRDKGLEAVGDRDTLIARLAANGVSKFDIAGIPSTNGNRNGLAIRDLTTRLRALDKKELNNLYKGLGLGTPGPRRSERLIQLILQQPQGDIEAALGETF